MPAVTTAVGDSGAVVPAIEPGSTGALASSELTPGQVSTSLPLGPPETNSLATWRGCSAVAVASGRGVDGGVGEGAGGGLVG